MNHFDRPETMSIQAHRQWCGVIFQLMTLQLAITQDAQIAVGRGQYRMHTTRSPNVKRAAHE